MYCFVIEIEKSQMHLLMLLCNVVRHIRWLDAMFVALVWNRVVLSLCNGYIVSKSTVVTCHVVAHQQLVVTWGFNVLFMMFNMLIFKWMPYLVKTFYNVYFSDHHFLMKKKVVLSFWNLFSSHLIFYANIIEIIHLIWSLDYHRKWSIFIIVPLLKPSKPTTIYKNSHFLYNPRLLKASPHKSFQVNFQMKFTIESWKYIPKTFSTNKTTILPKKLRHPPWLTIFNTNSPIITTPWHNHLISSNNNQLDHVGYQKVPKILPPTYYPRPSNQKCPNFKFFSNTMKQ